MWIAGLPGTGKTFFGDYLATRGWHHIDGDMGGRSKDEDFKAAFMKFAEAIKALKNGEAVAEQMWKPYITYLINEVKAAFKEHKKVVLSFAVLGVLGDAEFIEEHFPILKFVVV